MAEASPGGAHLRLVVLSVLAFFMMLSYSIARPATESLFLASQTSEGLPLAWLLVALAAVGTTAVYGRAVIRRDLVRVLGDSAGLSALVLGLVLGARAAGLPGADHALYVWKDIYVVVLVEAFYSYTNAVFPIGAARWAYGLFGVASSLGSVAGSLAVGWLAARVGSERSLLAVLPLLAAVWLWCIPFARVAGARAPAEVRAAHEGRLADAARVVRRSSYLALLLGLIGVVQVVVTLVDLEFNGFVEAAFPDTDERTGVIGGVYAATSVATVALHALTGPILRLAGVPLTLLAVPLLLAVGLVATLASPRLLVVAVLKGASKVFDYTIFRAAKEILYIPLSFAEKTLGKSLVDLLTYRLAKGAISAALLVVALVASPRQVAIPTALGLVVLWTGLTILIARRFRARVSRGEELGAGAGARRGS